MNKKTLKTVYRILEIAHLIMDRDGDVPVNKTCLQQSAGTSV